MLKFLVFILIIYIIFVVLFRFVIPYLLKRFVNRMQKKIFNQNNDNFQQQQRNTKKKGEISIDFIPPKSNSNTDKVGEYIDYEEIK